MGGSTTRRRPGCGVGPSPAGAPGRAIGYAHPMFRDPIFDSLPALEAQIEAALAAPLPGEDAQSVMAPSPRPTRTWDLENARTAAALLVLYPRGRSPPCSPDPAQPRSSVPSRAGVLAGRHGGAGRVTGGGGAARGIRRSRPRSERGGRALRSDPGVHPDHRVHPASLRRGGAAGDDVHAPRDGSGASDRGAARPTSPIPRGSTWSRV